MSATSATSATEGTADTPLRILAHLDPPPALRARLDRHLDGLDVRWCAEDDEARLAALLPDTEVLWHVLRPVTAADLERAPRLRLIQKLGSGVNTIDLDQARKRSVAVANMPGANAQAVTEATLALMLAAMRRVIPLDADTRAGRGWPLETAQAEHLGELGGRTVGLIGFGQVARRLAPVLTALGARVLRHDRSGGAAVEGDPGDTPWRPLETLLAESDVVSLHLPLTEHTEGLLDARRIGLMKPGALLVNTARGGLVDESALTAALRDGRLGAAGLDVFAQEPVAPDNPLLALPNVVVAPHLAWLTAETLERCVAIAADNARRLASGAEVAHRVE
ncbi:2-hydroxyacid dehydrogenase [Streptomyces endophyticus]|uniref:2-hydroxyacid dehydrogenase n=1 Tax=Streptomyces endophyticus TaxID=714166 RepID=A0ABU6F9L8_9ACTN|nr:2-hydroxyacid dehydrogenase [Streptomyces endophyticus]MEB8340736.1 2-hydroxyacid dehydrogenase [Streptomyces endophyticus]